MRADTTRRWGRGVEVPARTPNSTGSHGCSLVVTVALMAFATASAEGQRIWTCTLSELPETWSGECVGPNDAVVGIRLMYDPESGPPWEGVWLDPERALELGVGSYDGDERFLIRDTFTWYFVDEWSVQDGVATLVFDSNNQAPPNEVDLVIVERAIGLMENPETWDRNDDRNCENDPVHRISLYCALTLATEREMGRAYHRLPAMGLARTLIIDRYPERVMGHPLMDFNNHPHTTLSEVRELLAEVRRRIRGGG